MKIWSLLKADIMVKDIVAISPCSSMSKRCGCDEKWPKLVCGCLWSEWWESSVVKCHTISDQILLACFNKRHIFCFFAHVQDDEWLSTCVHVKYIVPQKLGLLSCNIIFFLRKVLHGLFKVLTLHYLLDFVLFDGMLLWQPWYYYIFITLCV